MESEISALRSRITSDIERFSKLHLWYKELPFEGHNFILFPWKGIQPQNYLNCEEETEDLTWHIWPSNRIDEIPVSGIGKDVIMRKTVVFNCFLGTIREDSTGNMYIMGKSSLEQRYPNFETVLKKKYGNKTVDELILMEHHLQIRKASKNARHIIREMKERCPQWIGLPDIPKLEISEQVCTDNKRKNYDMDLNWSSEGVPVLNISIDKEYRKSPRPSMKENTIQRLKRKISGRNLLQKLN